MALPTRNTQLNEIADFDTFYNGGKGSGNFGHSGRPGKVGGSGKGQGSAKTSLTEDEKKVREGETWTTSMSDEELAKEATKKGDELAQLERLDKRKKQTKQDILWASATKRLYEDTIKHREKAREEAAAEKRGQISSELDDFAEFGGRSRRDDLKTISAQLTNLTADIKSARRTVEKLKETPRERKYQDRMTTLTRLGETISAIDRADYLLREKDFLKGIGDSKKTLIESAKKELERGKKTLSDYYEKMDEDYARGA